MLNEQQELTKLRIKLKELSYGQLELLLAAPATYANKVSEYFDYITVRQYAELESQLRKQR